MAKSDVKFKFDTKGIALFNLNKASTRIKKLAKTSLNSMLGTAQRNIGIQAPVGATGQLRDDVSLEIRELSGRVFAGSPYAIVINDGRKASPVSKDADPSLIRWLRVTRKGRKMLVWTRANMMKNRKSKPSTDQVIKSALYILKRSMKNKARPANPFFDRGIEKSQPFIKQESDRYIKDLAVALALP